MVAGAIVSGGNLHEDDSRHPLCNKCTFIVTGVALLALTGYLIYQMGFANITTTSEDADAIDNFARSIFPPM